MKNLLAFVGLPPLFVSLLSNGLILGTIMAVILDFVLNRKKETI